MGFHTFTAGEVLTAANVNAYLMNQAVISCTSGTRPSSPQAGMVVYETDTSTYSWWNGGAWATLVTVGTWSSYAAAWTGSVSNPVIGNGTITANYMQVGKMVTAQVDIIMGSTTTFGSGVWSFSLPVTGAGLTGTARPCGAAYLNHAGTFTTATVAVISTTTCQVLSSAQTTVTSPTVPFTWASGDQLHFTAIYQAA